MFNCAIQLGAALGLAIDTSIETSVEARLGSGGFEGFEGRRAVLWWMLAVVCVETLAIMVFYRVKREVGDEEKVAGSSLSVGQECAESAR